MASWQLSERIDHRSHAERGLEEQPTIHEGVAARAMEEKSMIADRCELNRQIKADNALMRELKEKIRKLKQAVMDSIPAVAEALLTIRDKAVLFQYQFMHNNRQLRLIDFTLEEQRPIFQEYHSIQRLIKAKQEERKSLAAERKACSSLKIVTINTLTKQITTLTEDIEELKSRKAQLLSRLKCADDKEAQAAEKRIPEMERAKERLTRIQAKLPAQANEVAGEYIRIENAVPAERWNQVKDRMRIIIYDHWETVLRKLKEIYAERFNRELYDDAQRHVDDHLPERSRIEEPRSNLERENNRIRIEVDMPKARRRNENIL